jgi:CBS domain-containing protein
MKVQQIMTTDVKCCQPKQTIQDAAKVMASENCGSVPVCDNNKVVGMITDRDIVVNAIAKGTTTSTVRECMSTNIVTCTPDTDAHEASTLMARHQIRRLPVVNAQGELCGICAIGDLATVDIHINEAGDALSKISEPQTATFH